MAIAIPISESVFDVQTYDGLVDYIIAKLELDSNTDDYVPTWIRLGEKRLNQLLTTPFQETVGSVTTTSGTEYVALPTGIEELRSVYLDSEWPLERVTQDTLREYDDENNKPRVYSVQAERLYLWPVPNATYTINLTYLTRLPALNDANQTNWLILRRPDIYLMAALTHASAFIRDKEMIGLYEQALQIYVNEANQHANRFRHAGPLYPRARSVA